MEWILYDASRKHPSLPYQSGLNDDVLPKQKAKRVFRYRSFLARIANGLIIISLASLILTFYPLLRKELVFLVKKIETPSQPVARAYFSDFLSVSPPEVEKEILKITAPDPAFSIVIPKIDAKAKIIANVDSTNQAAYNQSLKLGVAHAAGSSFPGSGETIWLFAHSTNNPWNVARYNAVFFLLRKLEPGDEIIVFFNHKRFNYRVFDKIIVEPMNVSFLENQGEEKLVLQTCWPPGTTLKRVIVLAKPTFY